MSSIQRSILGAQLAEGSKVKLPSSFEQRMVILKKNKRMVITSLIYLSVCL